MLGDYSRHTPTNTLLTNKYDNNIPSDLARLAGVRMVTAIEANFDRQLDEAKLKSMTGGEPITARFMRQNYFEFSPAFKLWLVANDMPRVRGTDTAFWRRVRVIPFEIQIPEIGERPGTSGKAQRGVPRHLGLGGTWLQRMAGQRIDRAPGGQACLRSLARGRRSSQKVRGRVFNCGSRE